MGSPPGLQVVPVEGGFVATLSRGSWSEEPVVTGAAALSGLCAVGLCAGLGGALTGWVDLPSALGWLALPAVGLLGASALLGQLAKHQERVRPQLTLTRARLQVRGPEGSVDLPLEAVEGVDLAPVGLALRVAGQGTVHLRLPADRPEARAWLRAQILDAVDRHGRPTEVPAAVDALRQRAES